MTEPAPNNQAERRSNFDEIMRQITELGEGTPEYHDALAFTLTIMAKRQWIIADHIRQSRRDRAIRQERAAKRKAEREAANS